MSNVRIKISELRSVIKENLREVIQPHREKFAIDIVKNESGGYNVIIYNVDDHLNVMRDVINNKNTPRLEILRTVKNSVIAMIDTEKINAPCWNKNGVAQSVQSVAAIKGYGPFAYNIALYLAGGVLISDRSSTSSDAANIWRGFAKGRSPGVAVKNLDNIVDPKTPQKIDDCEIPTSSVENLFSYDPDDPNSDPKTIAAIGDGIDPSPWVKVHESVLSTLSDEEKKIFVSSLDSLAFMFFQKMYKKHLK